MERQSLEDYVYRKFGLRFQAAVDDPVNTQLLEVKPHHPFAVLSKTSSWLDVKCPSFAETIRNLPHFTDPRLVNHPDWVEVNLAEISDHDLSNVLDYAFKAATNDNNEFVAQQLVYLPSDDIESRYQSQAIPQNDHNRKNRQVPPILQKMMESYDYTILPADEQGENFYRQGQLVADYEDDYDQLYELRRYYPDYHAMNVHQLRTYFTWRTQLRKGHFTVSSTSYAYVYLYELLNNIGVQNPDEGYAKLREFAERYAKNYGERMQDYLHQWLQDYVLYYGLDRQKANQMFADKLAADRDYHILLHPADYSATEVTNVFLNHCTYFSNCRLYKKAPEQWAKVVKTVWQVVLERQPQAFTELIATRTLSTKYFFAGAVFAFHRQPKLKEYPIDSERKYHLSARQYSCQAWYPRKDQAKQLNTFFHELDRLARQEFHLGHHLKERKMDERILQTILDGLRIYQQQRAAAQRPQVNLNLQNLERIRTDASLTRESLLTDEEKQDDHSALSKEKETQITSSGTLEKPSEKPEKKQTAGLSPVTPVEPSEDQECDDDSVPVHADLTANEQFLLVALLNQQPYEEYLKKHHLMVSILVDAINDKLFDYIGDAVIEFNEQDQPVIIEDYQPDLEELIKKED